MRIARVTDEQELVRLFAFRYRIFVEELGWMARKDLGAHILVDEFDRDAANYAAYDRATGEIIGSLRAVPDGPLGLPLERCRVLDGYRDGKRLVELSRLAAAPAWRGTRVAALLMKAGYQCAQRMGATHLVLDTYTGDGVRTERLYQKLGFTQLTEVYPDPDYLWKQGVVTFALDCKQARYEWPRERPSLHHFFTAADERIDHGARPGLFATFDGAPPADLAAAMKGPAVRRAERRRAPRQIAGAPCASALHLAASSSPRRAASTGRDE